MASVGWAGARRRLGMGLALAAGLAAATARADSAVRSVVAPDTAPEIAIADIRAHVAALASEAMAGRLTGEAGGRASERYAAAVFERIGLEPAGDDGTYFNAFTFSSGLALGEKNALTARIAGREIAFPLNVSWRPLGFSKRGEAPSAPVVFAGYGIVAEAEEERGLPAYDSFGEADLSGKWVLVWRGAPPGTSRIRRRQLMSGAPIFRKASEAAQRGAAGLIVAAGPGVGYRRALPRLSTLALRGSKEIPVVAIDRETAARFLRAGGEDPKAWATRLEGARIDGSSPLAAPKPLAQLRVAAVIDIEKKIAAGRNIVARLPLGGAPTAPPVVIGAHIDHLGRGGTYASMARPDEEGQIHYGADDNASGVAAMFEIAEHLAAERAAGRLTAKRDVIFAAWSGEEYGLFGSMAYVDGLIEAAGTDSLKGVVASYLNMDMVGRLEADLRVSGLGSAKGWEAALRAANAPLDLPLTLVQTPYVPTDASAFYRAGAPVISATTGLHSDYHSPRDLADRLNYDGTVRVARLMARLAEAEAEAPTPRPFIFIAPPRGRDFAREDRQSPATLGLLPVLTPEATPDGVLLEAVTPDGPAASAGARAGDRVTGIDGAPIAGARDFIAAMKRLIPGDPVALTLRRDGQPLRLTVEPAMRE